MVSIKRFFENEKLYHIFSRGIEKRDVFLNDADYERFLKTLCYYQQVEIHSRLSISDFEISDRRPPYKFSILAYCLMPNHFHLVIKQLEEGGITSGMSNIINSYTRSFNTKYNRVGSLFQRPFKSVDISNDEQNAHVIRYVLLNPYTARITDSVESYKWSSYYELLMDTPTSLCDPDDFMNYFKDKGDMKNFIHDYADYSRSLALLKDLLKQESK